MAQNEGIPIWTVLGATIIAITILLTLLGAWYTVPAGHRGVLMTWGNVNPIPKNEGFYLKIPIAQKVAKMEVRTQKIEVTADSASKDLQDVQTTIALNYHLEPSNASKLYQEIGPEYTERIILPAIQESAKATTAEFTAEELITKRPEARKEMQNTLTERISKYYLIIDGFNIVDFQFSEEFDKAIEQKVTAEQMALKAKRDLERIIIEKEQKITQAQAEAESIRIQSQALQENKDILQLRAIEKWDGILPKVTGTAIPFINIEQLNGEQK